MAALKQRKLDTTEMKRQMAAELDAKFLQAYASGEKTMSQGEHVSINGSQIFGRNPQNGGE